MTSFYGSSCANNGKDALNTPDGPPDDVQRETSQQTIHCVKRLACESVMEKYANVLHRGYGVDVRGYGGDVRGYAVYVRGYGVDVRGCGVEH
eukprot:6391462-Pyramimonas_sp.AAC.4